MPCSRRIAENPNKFLYRVANATSEEFVRKIMISGDMLLCPYLLDQLIYVACIAQMSVTRVLCSAQEMLLVGFGVWKVPVDGD